MTLGRQEKRLCAAGFVQQAIANPTWGPNLRRPQPEGGHYYYLAPAQLELQCSLSLQLNCDAACTWQCVTDGL